MKSYLIILLLINLVQISFSQEPYGLSDGRVQEECKECQDKIKDKPKEVSFGIHFMEDKIYLLMNSEAWFNYLFTQPTDGITIDLVSKDQFACGKTEIAANKWPTGFVLKPVYLADMKKRLEKLPTGGIRFLIQAMPDELKGKELEGNLSIVRKNKVCFNIVFANIGESLWNLLDMGLFTDSLLNQKALSQDTSKSRQSLFYNKSVSITVPFARGKASYQPADIKPLYDSLNLKGYTVKKIDIRAFSSIEGTLDVNLKLQQQRAQTIIAAIQTFQSKDIKKEVTSGENWVEFMQDISKTSQNYLGKLTKAEIKKKIDDNKFLRDSLESILVKHRKAIITIYMTNKNEADDIDNKNILESFNKAITDKNLDRAAAIQKSIFERIGDNRLPAGYLNQLEIPSEKPFSTLLNDKQVYKFLLNETSEGQAIRQLKRVEILDPGNAKVKYNICALQMRLWQYSDSVVDKDEFLRQINQLTGFGVRDALVNRMLINYKIVLCEIYMKDSRYELKDKLLAEIRKNYHDINDTDRDLLSLAKYFCHYAQYSWAEEILETRMDKLDVDEDLLFFYLNLCIFQQKNFTNKKYNDMLLNAISINNKRVCNFFNATGNGGISMQLLIQSFWKKIYCDNCIPGILSKTT